MPRHSRRFDRRIRRLLAQSPPELQALTREHVEALRQHDIATFNRLLALVRQADGDLELRNKACWLLGQLPDRRGVPALVATLNDPSAGWVRWVAACQLACLGGGMAVEALVTALLTSPDADQREAAAHGLNFGIHPRAFDPLQQALGNQDEKPRVRAQAAESLHGYCSPYYASRSIPHLLSALHDPDPEVRFWSVYALSQLAGEEVIPELERLAATDYAEVQYLHPVSEEAKWAIGEIRRRLEEGG
ncbi:MAG: HEAT repeat domain-containing protein [Armatimonadetes bacterium]|nr:HEAT repeat domain-containing protein [Armatimonadota bacterium]